MKKLFTFFMLLCITSVCASFSTQAQTFNGNLVVTAFGKTTTQPTQVIVVDNDSTAVLTIKNFSFNEQYQNLDITANVTKSGTQITGATSISVTSISVVRATSCTGTISSDNCTIDLGLKALLAINVQVHFESTSVATL